MRALDLATTAATATSATTEATTTATTTAPLSPSLVQESQQPDDAKESNPSTTQRSAPVPLYLRKPEGPFMPSICHHNKRRSQCYEEGTGGSTICHHRRQRYSVSRVSFSIFRTLRKKRTYFN
ncbi:hypothetical protein CcCBS67573_g09720 [Chytriomyces confervae]|uniref:Uncharacterized protein n=1 Tax=Chytriomyces confervae TaxID=246404 RepID=A0A507DQ20_9FUNG|nr:hypothetical protein CcCBS67573_g09720 [Chytriomyces confervae]